MAEQSRKIAIAEAPIEDEPEGAPGDPRVNEQMLATLWHPDDIDNEEKRTRIAYSTSLLDGIRPQDDLELMLAAQMIATHNGAMACMRRATRENGNRADLDVNLRHAGKLLSIYARQMDTLNKHRVLVQQMVAYAEAEAEDAAHALIDGFERDGDIDPGIAARLRARVSYE